MAATLADYVVLARRFKLIANSQNVNENGIVLTVDRPEDVVMDGNLRTSPMLAFTANPDGAASELQIFINNLPLKEGDAADHIRFTEGQPVGYHFVLDGNQLFNKATGNTIKFVATIAGGTIEIRDVVLWMQRRFQELPG
jgi:hypothetical protein